jgi:hypothetical protein
MFFYPHPFFYPLERVRGVVATRRDARPEMDLTK